MVTIVDIVRALTRELEAAVPGVRVTTKDITTGYTRPCFYISVDSMKGADANVREDTYSITVFYFGPDANTGWLDLLKVRETLRRLFTRYIQVAEDFYFYPDELEQELVREDMHLETSFEVTIYQQLPEDEDDGSSTEMLEDLEIHIEKET